jgi:hypothetical protein
MLDEFVPASESIFGWIETTFAQGVRRPGYPVDAGGAVRSRPQVGQR